MEYASSVTLIPVTLLTVSYLVTFRRSLQWFRGAKTVDGEESEDEYVEGEEDLLPTPEPLGGALAPVSKRTAGRSLHTSTLATMESKSPQRPALPPHFSYEKQRYELPLDLDATALRAKLIDADAAKRRAMTRLAELERETETLKRRCAELERKALVADHAPTHVYSFSKVMGDSLQSIGISQRLLTLAVPQLKYRGRGVMWA